MLPFFSVTNSRRTYVCVCLLQGTIPVSLGRFKRALTDEMERELAHHCRDLDSRFYGLTRKHVMKIAFDYTEMNGVSNRFNKEKKMAGKDWLKGFCKRNKLSVRTPEQCSMARAIGFNKVQVSKFYDNLKDCCLDKNFLLIGNLIWMRQACQQFQTERRRC